MEAFLLTPLIKEFVKDSHISEEDKEFVLQTAQELGVTQPVALQLIEVECRLQEGANLSPIQVAAPLIRSFVINGRISEANMDNLLQTLTDFSLTPEIIQALVDLECIYQQGQLPNNKGAFGTFIQSFMIDGKVSDFDTAFLNTIGVELGFSPDLITAMIRLESAIQTKSRNARNTAQIFYPLIKFLAENGRVSIYDQDMVTLKAEQLRVSPEIVKAFLNFEEASFSGQHDSTLFLIPSLLRAFMKAGNFSDSDIVNAIRQVLKLNLNEHLIQLLIQIESETIRRSTKVPANLLLQVISFLLRNDGKINPTEMAFITEKAAQLEIPSEVILGLIEVETAIIKEEKTGVKLITPLIKAFSKSTLFTKDLISFIVKKGLQLGATEKSINALIQIEVAIQKKSAGQKAGQLEEDLLSFMENRQADSAQAGKNITATATPPATVTDSRLREQQIASLPVEKTAIESIFFADNGGNPIWYVIFEQEGEKILFSDGKILPASQIGEISIAPAKNHIAYKIHENGKEVMIIDGKPTTAYDAIQNIVFNAKGDLWVMVVKQGKLWHTVTSTGKTGKGYATIRELVISPTEEKFAYSAYENGKWAMIENEKEGAKFSSVGGYTYSENGKSTAYIIIQDKRHSVVLNGKQSSTHESLGGLTFNPDGSQFGYWAKEGNKEFIVVNGQKGEYYESVNRLIFSGDSKHIAKIVTLEKKKTLFLDDKKIATHEEISNLAFTGQNNLMYKFLDKEKWHLSFNGNVGAAYNDIDQIEMNQRGEQYAYYAKQRGSWTGVVKNGVQGKEFLYVESLIFADKSDSIAFLHRKKGGSYLVLDDKITNAEPFDVASSLDYCADKNRLSMIAIRGKDILYVTLSL